MTAPRWWFLVAMVAVPYVAGPWWTLPYLIVGMVDVLASEGVRNERRRAEERRRVSPPPAAPLRRSQTIWTRIAMSVHAAMVPTLQAAAEGARKAAEAMALVVSRLPPPTVRCYCGAVVPVGVTSHDHVLRMAGAIPPDPMTHHEAVREAIGWAVGYTRLRWPHGIRAYDADTLADYVIENADTPAEGLAKFRDLIETERPAVIGALVHAVELADAFEASMDQVRTIGIPPGTTMEVER